jgi:hypothetical protein
MTLAPKYRASATLAGQGEPAAPIFFKSMTGAQRKRWAEWVIGRLSPRMSKNELINVLKIARKLALEKKEAQVVPPGADLVEALKNRSGRPAGWGRVMDAEIEAYMEVHLGASRAAAIRSCMPAWRSRYPGKADHDLRRYYYAARQARMQCEK